MYFLLNKGLIDMDLKNFADFLVGAGAVCVGDFTLKSGKKAPYFINTGVFDTGEKIQELGKYYAAAIETKIGSGFDLVFGPAYKGIPLAVATAIALNERGIDKSFCFDRKEKKEHGDKGELVGAVPGAGARVVIVDDVITTGGTKKTALEFLKARFPDIVVVGVVVLVDREEKTNTGRTAVEEFEEQTGIRVFSVAKISELYAFLPGVEKIKGYLKNEGII